MQRRSAALFILVDSGARLLGHLSSLQAIPQFAPLLGVAALCGGVTGSFLGSRRLPVAGVIKALSLVLTMSALSSCSYSFTSRRNSLCYMSKSMALMRPETGCDSRRTYSYIPPATSSAPFPQYKLDPIPFVPIYCPGQLRTTQEDSTGRLSLNSGPSSLKGCSLSLAKLPPQLAQCCAAAPHRSKKLVILG